MTAPAQGGGGGFNWGDLLKGMLMGGGAGAAALGAHKAGMFDPNKVSTMDEQQQGLYDQKYQAIQGGGGPLGDIYGFDADKVRGQYTQQYAEPAYQQFQEQTVPGITGAFRGQNLQNSSYLGGALGQAGTNVQKDLNAQLSGMLSNAEQQSLSRKQSGVNDLLNMQTFAYEDSPLMKLLSGLAGGVGKVAGAAAGKYI